MQDLKVTLIQSNLHWENKFKNLEMFAEKISAVEETDLILLPEMFTTGFTMNASAHSETMNGETVEWMKNISHKKNCVVAGSIIINDNGSFYNRLIWMKPDGMEYYDKRHLFSFAGEDSVYKPGNKKLSVSIKGWNILPLICYDLRFPVWSRRNNLNNYDLLLYVANWPERRIYAWKQLLIARAIENQCYVAGLNRIGNDGNNIFHSGDSAVIDYKGELTSSENQPVEFVSTYSLSHEKLINYRKQFGFYNDSDHFEIK